MSTDFAVAVCLFAGWVMKTISIAWTCRGIVLSLSSAAGREVRILCLSRDAMALNDSNVCQTSNVAVVAQRAATAASSYLFCGGRYLVSERKKRSEVY